jgi:hypothetical protein
MIFSPFPTLLVAAIGSASLAQPGDLPADGAAIALTAIAATAQKKHGAAFGHPTASLSKHHFAAVRHAAP